MNNTVQPCLAAPAPNKVHPAIIGLAAFIVAVGAIPGPLVWLMNLSAVPVLLVGMIRFPYTEAPEAAWNRFEYLQMRVVLFAAWTSALLHHVVHP